LGCGRDQGSWALRGGEVGDTSKGVGCEMSEWVDGWWIYVWV